MTSIIYQTESAIFEFRNSDVNERLNQHASERRIDEEVQILNLISTASVELGSTPVAR